MKSINLLPKEYRKAEFKSQLKKGIVYICVILVVYFAFLGFGIYRLKTKIADVNENINEGKRMRARIELKKQELVDKELFLENLDEALFPFYDFTKFLIVNKPLDLDLISVDTLDRMWGSPEEYNDVDTNDDENDDTNDDENSDENDGENSDINDESEDEVEDGAEEDIVVSKASKVSDMMVVVRGSSKNISSISNYIYKISLLDYVRDVSLTAIEEMETPNGVENVFEIVLDIE